jgi:hypothetical protein
MDQAYCVDPECPCNTNREETELAILVANAMAQISQARAQMAIAFQTVEQAPDAVRNQLYDREMHE